MGTMVKCEKYNTLYFTERKVRALRGNIIPSEVRRCKY